MNVPEVTRAEFKAEIKRIARGEPGWSQIPVSRPAAAKIADGVHLGKCWWTCGTYEALAFEAPGFGWWKGRAEACE